MRDMTHSGTAADLCGICVILNGKSGRQDRREHEALMRAFRESGLDVAVKRPSSGDRIAAAAAEAVAEGYGIVVAAGGDGTQSAVAGALAGTDVAMGIVPMGTFNFFAREHGIDTDAAAAVATIRQGRIKRVSVGDINGQIFLNNASFGLYPAILRAREDIYRRWGRSRLAAYWSVLSVLMHMRRPMVVDIQADGIRRRYETPLAFVGNSAYQLRIHDLAGAEAVGADRFALLLARARTPWALLASALRLARRSARQGVDFDLVCADEIVIATRTRTRLVARDGEKARMRGPFRLTVRSRALKIIVPTDAPDAP